MFEIKGHTFELDSVKPIRGKQNAILYPLFLEYMQYRKVSPDRANKALEKMIWMLDPLVVRYTWALKKWPGRSDFHPSYYRDLYRLRKYPPVSGNIEDVAQYLREKLILAIRKYKNSYCAPIAGYASRALCYACLTLIQGDKRGTKFRLI